MRTMIKLRVVSQKQIFDEVEASLAAKASRFKYSTSEKKEKYFQRAWNFYLV